MKVLVVGHALGPGLGSEPGNTWNFVCQLASEHEVVLLAHPQFAQRVQQELTREPRANLRINWVTLPAWMDPWRAQRGEKGLKLHYALWQRHAADVAMKLCRQQRFDVAHHFSWGTVNAPPRLDRLPIPVIWGPMGGGQTMPLAFRAYFKGHLSRELLRHATTRALPFTPALRRMAQNSSVVLTTNLETRRIVERGGGRRVEMFLDNGLPIGFTDHSTASRADGSELRILWAGRCEPRKALPLGLEAVAQTRAPVRLLVAGDGPLLDAWRERARELGVEARVDFLGRVPWETMSRLFKDAHVFLFTSLRDSFGSVVLEAMGHGLPILTLNHQGVRDFVPNDGGIKVSVIDPAQTVRELAEAMETLAVSPQRRTQMGAACLEFARTQTWDQRTQRLVALYEQAMQSCRGSGKAIMPRPAAAPSRV